MNIAVQLTIYIGFLTDITIYVALDQARTVHVLFDPPKCFLLRYSSTLF